MASLKRWLDRRRNPWKAEFLDAYSRWKSEKGPVRLYDYGDLPKAPVVLDFGGFKGEWSDIVLKQAPDAIIHIFEPHPGFAALIREKFADNPNIHVHELALGAESREMELSDAGDASSSVANHDRVFTAQFLSVDSFIAETPLPRIDLVKINIEGGEYELLPALIASGVLARVARLQVQFHLFEPALSAARAEIRADLAKTHECVWDYPFVWEEWRRNDPPET
ncbi:FkbM family methyltransferase [Shimia thalassica]|uniref:FkbM family methyltransferase n=1 Tax=Shimia thalassica TaxID=1715693 RepID=UPI0026E2FDCF|nr:FkbM family methyltransferase [Shimia thalassica]MDO6480643.1 FkbM family methyltransferase [Shimia thalassica]MDO6799424.1 FkbM family methyltransferase [Shimia thalassica]MDP2495199.1 FkbM family methyltransferase [Shimia thalassica]